MVPARVLYPWSNGLRRFATNEEGPGSNPGGYSISLTVWRNVALCGAMYSALPSEGKGCGLESRHGRQIRSVEGSPAFPASLSKRRSRVQIPY